MENIQFRAFHHIEGLYKVAVEFGLMAIFHNVKKLGKTGKNWERMYDLRKVITTIFRIY